VETFQSDGYTTEEQKLVDETRKILEDQTIMVTATVVRILWSEVIPKLLILSLKRILI